MLQRTSCQEEEEKKMGKKNSTKAHENQRTVYSFIYKF